MNLMKHWYSSGGEKLHVADKSRKFTNLQAADLGTPSISSFFKIQDSSADIPVTEAVVEKADTAEEEANISPVS